MEEIKNSSLLDEIISHAKGEKPTLTAEALLLTSIRAAMGELKFDGEKVSDELVEVIGSIGADPAKLADELRAYTEERKPTFTDSLYMQSKMLDAKGLVRNAGGELLTPEIVIKCILGSPSSGIKTCIEKAAAASAGGNGGAGQEDSFDFSKVFRQTGGEDAASEEAEPEVHDAASAKTKVAELTGRAKNIHAELAKTVFGQDNALSIFTSGYFQGELLAMTDKKRTRPRATFLFAGPPGVGKTFLAEKAAEILGLPFMRFDMSEYSGHEAGVEFCGSDSVYKNGKEGNVTKFVAKNPKCLLLFDEIEKAHISIIHLFLQLLDAGRLRDNYTDKEVPFADAIIILTTNAGRQLYENSESGDFSGVSRKVILKALQRDVDPSTGAPFFPAAICSRFASGNVVMFNSIAAHDLREIAKREVLRHAGNFEREVGIEVEIDERVYSSLLFAEGGAADARTIRSRAETFFDDEIFELFRLIGSERVGGHIDALDKITVGVELPGGNSELLSLFRGSEDNDVLVFASRTTAERCAACGSGCNFLGAQSIDEASNILRTHDVKFIIVDMSFGVRGNGMELLNFEDAESDARDFFRYVREYNREIPVYILQNEARTLGPEERVSFLRQGARGTVTLLGDGRAFAEEIDAISDNLYQQRSMENLAKANKVVTFETSQSLSRDGKQATIRLFDFKMTVAVDPEDTENILSSVSRPNVSFDQVIGAEDAKRELRYFVNYLKNPKKYLGTGVKAPKGVILYGPPGTGKTMLAKAMASESDVTFITAEGNQFLKKYVGEGPEKVHELFRAARKYAPSILFIDEIDAIAKERRGAGDGGSSDVSEATLTAFLTEMDGFKNDPTKPVFVLAATNFEVEGGSGKSLDPALMRRFDRRVFIDLPDREARKKYIGMKLAGNSAFDLSCDMTENIAVRSTGMSLAELESVFELALRSAIRDGAMRVTDAIFEEAFETFNSGDEKKWDASLLERVARHEAGHAFLCWQSGETPSYLTIVARGDHGGYMQHADNEGRAISTRDELFDRIRTSLGGRAAEIVYYGSNDGISTGASGDLATATRIARHMICTYGMDDEFGLAVVDQKSAMTGELSGEVRRAVNGILSTEMERAISIISANRAAIDAIVEILLSKNHMTAVEINEVFEKTSDARSEKTRSISVG